MTDAQVLDYAKRGYGARRLATLARCSESTMTRRLRQVRLAAGIASPVKSLRNDFREQVEQEIHDTYVDAIRKASRLRLTIPRNIVEWMAPKHKMVGVAFMGDLHAMNDGTDHDAIDRDVELILNTPGLYVVMGGDYIDNDIKHLAATIAAHMPPGEQWRWLEEFLPRIAPKMVALVGGNHDAWTAAASGFDPLRGISARIGVPYDSDEVEIVAQVGGQRYTLCVRHKYHSNSRRNPENSVRAMWEFGDSDFDAGVVCDKHTATVAPFMRHKRERWLLRPGSYKVIDKYARQHGFHGVAPVTPVLVVRPDRRDMHAFASLDWACEYLRTINGGKK